MKAVRVNEFGKPVQLEDMPRPVPADDEVLVRVRAASVNPIDWKIAAGYLGDYFPIPRTLGQDFAGDVEEVGSDVRHFKPGDAVFGFGSGSMAEYVVVKAESVALKPRTIDYIHSAAIGLTGLCAWQSLFDVAHLESGDHLLIHGTGGGVGLAAAQLAKNKGAYVIAHVREDQSDLLTQLGADLVLDSSTQRFEEYAGNVDVVLDLVDTGEYSERSMVMCRPGTYYVTPAIFLAPDAGKDKGIIATLVATEGRADELTRLAEEIDAGRLKVFVGRTFPLEEAQQALGYKRPEGAIGKVVLTVD